MAATYRLGVARRAVNVLVRALLRAGLGPPRTYLLGVRGRKSGRLLTTPVTAGILPGVTRATVMRLARRLAPVVERRIAVDDLLGADEVFLTSSTIEVVPIVRVTKRAIAGGRIGELTRELQIRYRRNVARCFGVSVDDLGE